jgi:hypothetical protein
MRSSRHGEEKGSKMNELLTSNDTNGKCLTALILLSSHRPNHSPMQEEAVRAQAQSKPVGL